MRRKQIFRGLLAVALGMLAGPLLAQSGGYPNKPIRVVVPFAVGSGTDLVARLVMEEVQKRIGVSVIVDNRPGAQGQIAAETVAKAAPDGYTLMYTTNTAHSANPFLFKKLGYDPIKDFAPVARVNYFVFLLAVNAASNYRTPQDLVAAARAKPDGLVYGYGNSTGQVAGAHFVKATQVKALPVAYKSTPPAMTDLSGGQFDFIFVDLASARTFLQSNRLRAIAVQSDKRSSLLPDLPPAGDVAPGFTFVMWGGVLAPAGTPDAIVERLNHEIREVLAQPAVRERMSSQGLEPAPSTAAELRQFMVEQIKAWGEKIQAAGITPE